MTSLLWYLLLAGAGQTWGYAVVDAALAAYFWWESRRRYFPVPLFLIHQLQVVFLLLATVADLQHYWIAMAINRMFELSLLYIIGCSIYRIRALRRKRRGGAVRSGAAWRFSPRSLEELRPAALRSASPRAAMIGV